jgi:hypothetical protein
MEQQQDSKDLIVELKENVQYPDSPKAPQLSDSKPDRQEERKKDLLKEIELIQAVITRMANTSSLVKGWTITMITFIFAFKSDQNTLPLVFIQILLFWFLDGYFLQHERIYRKLYAWVVANRLHDDSHLFSLSTERFKAESQPILSIMFTRTLAIFYGGALVLVSLYLLLFYK